MKKITAWSSATTLLLLLSAPASADSVIQIWHCTIDEGSTAEQLVELSEDWLNAAKSMEGGKDLRVLLEYPIAAEAGFGRFAFVLIAPDAQPWGIFMDGYDESAAAEVDEAWNEVATCSGSSVWQSTEVGAE